MGQRDRSMLREHPTTSMRICAYARLREAIVRAAMEPRRRLSENELPARVNVSRTLIRDALVRLRDERLVEFEYAAADLPRDDVREHWRVINAVADNHANCAEALLRGHLRNVLQEVPRVRAMHPGFFEEA